jgi:2'-5' RNA ligase
MTATPAVLRLFVALPVPSDVRQALAELRRSLQAGVSPSTVRWTDPSQVHLTLRFLGKVAADRVEALAAALSEALRGLAPARLIAEGIGYFPHPRHPRVIWVGVRDSSGGLAALQAATQSACAPFTLEPPEPAFHPHLTLGRIKSASPAGTRPLIDAARGLEDRRFGEWTADGVELMRSELGSAGSRHTCLVRIPLSVTSNL